MTVELLIGVRKTVESSGEGEVEEAGSRERAEEEAGTEMAEKRRAAVKRTMKRMVKSTMKGATE